jgi:hypothetical protein
LILTNLANRPRSRHNQFAAVDAQAGAPPRRKFPGPRLSYLIRPDQVLQRLFLAQNPEIGAYTELYAGLQADLDVQKPAQWSKLQ